MSRGINITGIRYEKRRVPAGIYRVPHICRKLLYLGIKVIYDIVIGIRGYPDIVSVIARRTVIAYPQPPSAGRVLLRLVSIYQAYPVGRSQRGLRNAVKINVHRQIAFGIAGSRVTHREPGQPVTERISEHELYEKLVVYGPFFYYLIDYLFYPVYLRFTLSGTGKKPPDPGDVGCVHPVAQGAS